MTHEETIKTIHEMFNCGTVRPRAANPTSNNASMAMEMLHTGMLYSVQDDWCLTV